MATKPLLPQWVQPGWVLALFALVTVTLLALTYENTKSQIEAQVRQRLESSLQALLVPGSYDNDPVEDIVEITTDPKHPMITHRARKDGQIIATLIRTAASDGYNGSIHLLVGIRDDGSLLGVRVLSHRETPGLGDKIDLRRSDWIHSFDNRSLADPAPTSWAVKKDGGTFDSFTGATITPRAVVKAVKQTLLYFQSHRQALAK